MNFKKITFKNGLRLVLIPQPQSLAATVLILVEAGSEYETKNINGLSHFLEHMMFKGTKTRPDAGLISNELDGIGAEYNAFTGPQYTGYWAKVQKKEIGKALDIVSDLYLNPIFNPDEIDKERGVIIEEINMYEDTPMRRVQEVFTNLLYGDQPAGWDIAGRKEVIRALKREDFIKYREKHYVAPKTTVVIAGSFDKKKVEEKIKGTFLGLPRRQKFQKLKTVEKQAKPEVAVKFKDSDQSHLILGVRAFDVFDKRRYAIQLLANVLGGGMSSRLFRRVRDELGAAYYVRAEADLTLDHGFFSVSSGVDHNKINRVLEVVLEEMNRFKKDLVLEKELEKSKEHMIGNFVLSLETSDEVASFFGGQEIITKQIISPEEAIKKMRAVTAKEIQKVAHDIFVNKNLNLAIIGPYKDEARFRKLLKL
ncbi:MAG: pitrilysin family protein [Candidatus Paceibacterota bacterium]|jgi:predicted Zn-dependent peptidase